MSKRIRCWRVMDAVPFGKLVWFDPSSETVELHDLPEGELPLKIDRSLSVSALPDGDGDAHVKDQLSLLPETLPF